MLFWFFLLSQELFQQLTLALLILHFWIESIHELWRRSHCGLGIQVFLYVSANKAHHCFKVCATTKFLPEKNTTMTHWDTFDHRQRFYQLTWQHFRYFRFVYVPLRWGTSEMDCVSMTKHVNVLAWRGWSVAVIATGIFLGHLFLLMAFLPRQITLLTKYLDLNSPNPLRGQNKLFNWYTVHPQTFEFRGRSRWVTGVNSRTKGYSTDRIYSPLYIARVKLNVPTSSELCRRDNSFFVP